MNQPYILSQGTYVPNMDLICSHKAELLHNSLVAMVTVYPYQQGKLVIHTFLKKVSPKLE